MYSCIVTSHFQGGTWKSENNENILSTVFFNRMQSQASICVLAVYEGFKLNNTTTSVTQFAPKCDQLPQRAPRTGGHQSSSQGLRAIEPERNAEEVVRFQEAGLIKHITYMALVPYTLILH